MPYDDKPFSAACERNKQAILEQLQRLLEPPVTILEIGSGTGQHAVHFAQHLPQVYWQASDRADNLPGISRWIDDAELPNLPPALELDVGQASWPEFDVDGVFSANTAHIMPWSVVCQMFSVLAGLLRPGSIVMLYGPFNDRGQFTSEGNERLDAWARATFPGAGLRDLAEITTLAASVDLPLREDVPMPANNRLLVFEKPS